MEEAHGHLTASARCDTGLFHLRTLSTTSHTTSAFCKGAWEVQVLEYIASTMVSARNPYPRFTDEEPEGSR